MIDKAPYVFTLLATLSLAACQGGEDKKDETYPFALHLVKSNTCGIESAKTNYTVSVLNSDGSEALRLTPNEDGKVSHVFEQSQQTLLVVEENQYLNRMTLLKAIQVSDLGTWHSQFNDKTGCDCPEYDVRVAPGNRNRNHLNLSDDGDSEEAETNYKNVAFCQPTGEQEPTLVAYSNLETGLHYLVSDTPSDLVNEGLIDLSIQNDPNVINKVNVTLPEGITGGSFHYATDGYQRFYSAFRELEGANLLNHDRVTPIRFTAGQQIRANPFLKWEVAQPLPSFTEHLAVSQPEMDHDQLRELVLSQRTDFDFTDDVSLNAVVQRAFLYEGTYREEWMIVTGLAGQAETNFDLPADYAELRPEGFDNKVVTKSFRLYDFADRLEAHHGHRDVIRHVLGYQPMDEPLADTVNKMDYTEIPSR